MLHRPHRPLVSLALCLMLASCGDDDPGVTTDADRVRDEMGDLGDISPLDGPNDVPPREDITIGDTGEDQGDDAGDTTTDGDDDPNAFDATDDADGQDGADLGDDTGGDLAAEAGDDTSDDSQIGDDSNLDADADDADASDADADDADASDADADDADASDADADDADASDADADDADAPDADADDADAPDADADAVDAPDADTADMADTADPDAFDGDTDTGFPDVNPDVLPDVLPDLWPDAGDLGDSDLGDVGECGTPTDCSNLYGAAPCGSWECNAGSCDVVCGGCTDNDLDGYGAEGPGTCAGYDCDDSDDTVFDSSAARCYSGVQSELAVPSTACRAGTQYCVDGTWGQCLGEVLPTAEACNLLDDDCDGGVDEGFMVTCGFAACQVTQDTCDSMGQTVSCTPDSSMATSPDDTCDGVDDDCDGVADEDCGDICLHVATSGNNTQATMDWDNGVMSPRSFRDIQTAINYAASNAGAPQLVCVAADDCGSASYNENLTMADGVSVIGNWNDAFTARCNFNWSDNPVTAVFTTIRGATFTNISSSTALDGFEINRTDVSPSIGVEVFNSTNVALANLDILRSPSVGTAIGVEITNASDVVLTSSSVHGGNGTNVSVGVWVEDSRVDVVDNCEDFTGGRCDNFCGQDHWRSIRGRHDDGARPFSAAIALFDSPNSVIDRTAACGTYADIGATVFVTGESDGIVISRNLINGWGGESISDGIRLEDCDGGSPWIVDNQRIASAGEDDGSEVAALRALGACHPVIEDNQHIVGGGEGNASEGRAVYCQAGGGPPSRCVVLDNVLIEGSENGVPPLSVGVTCEDGSCVRVEGNTIDARDGAETFGVILENTGAVVGANYIDASCGGESTGVLSIDSWARIENNQITGGYCSTDDGEPFVGLHAITTDSGNELDVHSNVIDAGPNPAAACFGDGVLLEADVINPPAGPVGIFRNNVFLGSDCNAAYLFREFNHNADPRILQANVFDDRNGGVLYHDVDVFSPDLTTAGQINSMTDVPRVGLNKDQSCVFMSYPTDIQLAGGDTECVDAGVTAGAPPVDFMGDPRDDGMPDIGADER